jgi:beta-lactamase class D
MANIFKKIAATFIFTLFGLSVGVAGNCFIAIENGQVVKTIGECEERYSPFSTFKVPLAVMGFDAGILTSPDHPKVTFTEEINQKYITYHNPEKYPIMHYTKRDHTPQSWMTFSVVWYSRYITHALGKEKFQEYVENFNYGNKDVSGNPGKNDGLMHAWIEGSLKISPREQAQFIEKLANYELPVSKQAQENTINIIKLETIYDGWQLYGKTGGSMELGWFVGWIEKEDRRIAFAQYVEPPQGSLISGGLTAKEVAKGNCINVIFGN